MNDAIATVHSEDVEKVRRLLQGAISQANDAWLPSSAIFDALTLELIEFAGRYESPAQIAAHLTEVAALIGRAQTRSH